MWATTLFAVDSRWSPNKSDDPFSCITVTLSYIHIVGVHHRNSCCDGGCCFYLQQTRKAYIPDGMTQHLHFFDQELVI